MIRLALPLARRRYRQVMAEIEQAYDALVRTDDPMDRHILLERRARLTSDLADLHNAAFGDGPVEGVADMAGVLRVQATLQHLVAATELSVAMATWAQAIELEAGTRIWHHGWVWVSSVSSVRTGIRAEFDQGRNREIYEAHELVRTGGEDRFPAVELAVDAGVPFAEAREWYFLSVIASRDHRASMLRQLSEMAEPRIGGRASGVLWDLADTEAVSAA